MAARHVLYPFLEGMARTAGTVLVASLAALAATRWKWVRRWALRTREVWRRDA